MLGFTLELQGVLYGLLFGLTTSAEGKSPLNPPKGDFEELNNNFSHLTFHSL